MGLPRNGGHFTDQPSCTSGRLPGGQFSQPLRFDGPFQARDRLDASLSPLGPTGLATAYELNRLMFVAPSILAALTYFIRAHATAHRQNNAATFHRRSLQ